MMRTSLVAAVLLACVTITNAQKQGIGLRLGDPMGITYKNYLNKTRSVEFILGSASRNWHGGYYLNSFESYSQYDNYRYISHEVLSTLYLQARYLLNYDIQIDGMVGRLDWYWGVGAMLKSARVRYTYRGDLTSSFIPPPDTKTDIDLGPEGIIGLEYKFQDVPVSVFGETSLMIELADRPGALRVFGGVGVRYNFNRLQ